jgi:hypothetical protein
MRIALVVDKVWNKLSQNALPLSVFAATAAVAAFMGPIAANNMTVHEVLHNLRHALGLPCH